jgi:polyphosphate kinase 2
MSKKSKKKDAKVGKGQPKAGAKRQSKPDKKPRKATKSAAAAANAETGKPERIDRQTYEEELAHLHGELVKVQLWLKESGAKVMVVFEGRDAAGKGGVIKRITDRVSPRVFRIVALPAPSKRERSQLYMQRYIERFPAGGECVLFDRSWYNRAGVERVMGYCSEAEAKWFLKLVPLFERAIVDGGIQLIKYWFDVSKEEQTRRFQSRIDDPRKIWKLSPMDLESHRLWYDYSRARDEMFAETDTSWAPWHVVNANDKRRARLNCIAHLLSVIPYKETGWKKPKLPDRQKSRGYVEPEYSYRYIPERY